MQQICKKCQQQQDDTQFYRDNSYSSGYTSTCKVCTREAHALWRAQNTGYFQRYHAQHKAEQNAKKAVKRVANVDAIRAYQRARRHGPQREQILARERARHQRDSIARNAKRHAHHYANLAHERAVARAHYLAHKEERRLYIQSHPEIAQLHNARRRAQKLAAPLNDFTKAQWKAMKEHYGYRCVYCHRKMRRLTMDHMTPLSRGGAHTLANIVPACQPCNSRKYTGAPLVPVQPLLVISS